MDQPQATDYLKKQHAFEEWRDRNTLPENLFVWRYFLNADQFSGWKSHRIQSVDAAGWPASIQSIWQQVPENAKSLVRVDTFECASRREAHEVVLKVLGEFQSPAVTRDVKSGLGDVAFRGTKDAYVVFARANLVFHLGNAGGPLVPVGDLANTIEAELVRKHEPAEGRVVPEIRVFESRTRELNMNTPVALAIEAADPLGRPLWYKFFARSGEVRLVNGLPVYQPLTAGPQEISVVAINASRGSASRSLSLNIR